MREPKPIEVYRAVRGVPSLLRRALRTDATSTAVPRMYRSRLCVVVATLLAAIAGGCATVQFGKEFDSALFESSVEIGVSTQAEVRTWLGEPASTGIVVDEAGRRYTRWIYYFGEGTLPRLRRAEFKMLEVRFDNQAVVHAYNWTSSR